MYKTGQIDVFGNDIVTDEYHSGKEFEKHIATILRKYDGCEISEQVTIGNKFRNHKHIVDILINSKIIVSVKLQNTGGTTEEKVGYEMWTLKEKILSKLYTKAFIICGGSGWTIFENLLKMSKDYPEVTLIRYEDDKTLSFIKNEI